ncbi:hypothetical protein T439DRAFT_351342 [Meredithblackwellia eburnea MCA 4105]
MLCDHPPACPPECDHCLAFDRLTRTLCSRAPCPGSKWCAVHEELQAKLLKSYKRLTFAVDDFPTDSLPPSFTAIDDEGELSQLRDWSEAARSKWSLTNKVIIARDEHHRQFYQGGDWGHCLFVSTLKDESSRMERMMRALDRRAYEITLAQSQAEWVLNTPAIEFICDEPAVEAPPTPPATPKLAATDLPGSCPAPPLSKSQRKRAQRKARKNSVSASTNSDDCCSEHSTRHLNTEARLARLRNFLVPPPDLPPSIRLETWESTIFSLFRLVILRVPTLAPLALNPTSGSVAASPDSISSFLDLLESRIPLKCGEEVKSLWEGLRFAKTSGKTSKDPGCLGVGVLADAIREPFRGEDEMSGPRIALLGGYVYKEASKKDLPREGWLLFYQFISCSGCSLSVTGTFCSWAANRRLALLGGLPAWLTPGETIAEQCFRLAGFVLCSSNTGTCGKKIKRVEQKELVAKKKQVTKTVIIEEWERGWGYFKLPRDNNWAEDVINALSESPYFSIITRDLTTSKYLHRPSSAHCVTQMCKCCSGAELWLGRVRSGLSPAERRSAKWSTTTFFAVDTVMDSLLKNSSPERRFGFKYTDCIEMLVVDERPYNSSRSDWTSFAEGISSIICQVRESADFHGLLKKERALAMESGELQPPAGVVKIGKSGNSTELEMTHAVYMENLTARTMFREI